ncbi:hypothetical protein [Pasteuria penetrans]|uniref:hypothetical protein n=1 Tax=Pasteuria penetrans TaxID=86005 RepID=UPI0011F08B32|nr:hypothetical protein [Pasteuria penetrans]
MRSVSLPNQRVLYFTNMTGKRENPNQLRASTFVRDKKTKEITRCVDNREPENSLSIHIIKK